MFENETLRWLQEWYLNLCDGEREHTYGISIGTIDNPGWTVEIDLRSSRFSLMCERELQIDHSDKDWMNCKIRDAKFSGAGDPTKLNLILHTFREWIEQAS